MAWCDVVEPCTLRECRIALGQSQAAFAATLGASPLAGDLGVNHRPQLCLILWFLPLKRDPGSDSLLHNERHL